MGRKLKYTNDDQRRQANRDKAMKYYWKNADKIRNTNKRKYHMKNGLPVKPVIDEEIREVPIDEDDDYSPKVIANKILSDSARVRLRARLLGTG